MTRKITTILLALALCLTLLPVGAGAAGTTGWVLQKDTDGTLKYGDYNVVETGTDGLSVTFDPSPEATGTTTVHGYVLNGGTYYLGEDVTIDKPLIIKGGTKENPVTLNLNGHVLKYNDTAKSSVIVVADSAYFVLQDTCTSEITYTYTEDSATKAWTNVTKTTGTDDNTITLTGGVITGGTGTNINGNDIFGGGVFVGSTANFKMTGGNIVGCAATSTGEYASAHGGGVFVCSGANENNKTNFEMTGGSIVGCTVGTDGGGVYVRGYADFTMNNARIANCTAKSKGGGVALLHANSTFTMNSSTIENCTAQKGGGVAVEGNTTTFTMKSGTTIKNCTAIYTGSNDADFASGGGVYLGNGKFNMEGGTIENCTATGSGSGGDGAKGGGVCVGGSGAFTMTGGTIKNCTVRGTGAKGDGVYIGDAMNANGGSVHGGAYINNGSALKNTSAVGSTIFYGSSKFGYEGGSSANPSIYGYRVAFKTGSSDTDLYAQTLVGVDGTSHLPTAKISEPDDPTQEGRHFAGWSYKKANNSAGTWDFTKAFEGNNPECDVDDDIPVTGADSATSATRKKVILTAEWHTLTEVSAKAATCTETGNVQYWKCTVDGCGELFEDNKGTEVDTNVTTAIDHDNHSFTKQATTENALKTAGTCTTEAVYYYSCTRCGAVNNAADASTFTGSNDPNNHVNLSAAYSHDSSKHWKVCSDCGVKVNEDEHSFGSDGKCSVCGYEKPRRVYRGGAPTISAVLSHPDAASATNYTSGIYGLTFRSTASFASFRGVQVDGKTIAASNYIAEEGSIVVYLKAVYLQTLPKGTHTVTILSTEGNATMNFTIGGVQSAKTADAGVAIYAVMALTSYTGTALVVRGRKRK